jgi:integrase
MVKRGQNEGSIYFDASRNRWVGAVSLGTGKRRKVSGKTKKEVQEQLTALLRDQQVGMLATGPRQTVNAYLDHWLENVAKPGVRPRTYDRYHCLMKLHVKPHVGKKLLDKLSGQDLQALYGRLTVTKDGSNGLHPRTVGHVHRCLHKALNDALKLGLVVRNVCDLVTPPKAPTPIRKSFTQDQARAFLTAIKGHRLEGLFTIALLTGMRQGELFALKWSDVQIEQRTLSVRRTVYFRKGHGVVWGEPKSASSTRRIDLDPVGVAALRRHKAAQAQERLLAGSKWEL